MSRLPRLPGYDYSTPGAYFTTVKVHNRWHLFGEIKAGQVQLSAAGQMAMHWWGAINTKFPTCQTDVFCVMPDHVHGIIWMNMHPSVGMARSGHPENRTENRGQPRRAAPTMENIFMGEKAPALGDIIGWFKTMTTNDYIRGVKNLGWPRFDGTLWQSNYHEHVIRTDRALENIRNYILTNPLRHTLKYGTAEEIARLRG